MSSKRLKCDLCNSDDLEILYEDVLDYESFIDIKINILKCKKCNLIQQSKIFVKDEIKKFYLDDYHGRNYNKKTVFSRLSLLLRAKYYKRFINMLLSETNNKNLKILDYGSGDGFLGKELYKKGFRNLYSCDFFKPKFEVFQKHILPSDISKHENFFDVIFMINSIEHLISFSKDFNTIDKSMTEKSILIIETPNFSSLDSLIFKKFWGGLHQPRHTFLWSKESIKNHLAIWNYDIQSYKSPQSAHWAISIQNILSARFKFFRAIIKNGRMPFYLVIVLIFLPFAIAQNLFDRQSVLNIIALRKKR